MCWNSEEHLTRRPNCDETAVIGTKKVHTGIITAMRSIGPGKKGLCLLTGDRVQFLALSQKRQTRFSVGRNAVATFIQDEATRTDLFDFNNGERAPLASLMACKFRILSLVGEDVEEVQPNNEATTKRELVAMAHTLSRPPSAAGRAMVTLSIIAVAAITTFGFVF